MLTMNFEDKSVRYETFVEDVARRLLFLLSRQRNDPETVSQNKAYEMFGRGNVDRWRRKGLIQPCIRPGKVEYRTAELRALQERVQDYFM
jgi:hypothetical protein